MTIDELRVTKRDEILRLAARRGAHNVRVFGSLVRGSHTASSDIDFLVELEPDRTLMDLGGLLMDLQAALHTQVDVATAGMLRPSVRERALAEATPL